MNESIRKIFPVTERVVYLDHASVTPVSTKVVDAMNWFLSDLQTNGPVNFPFWLKRVHEVRELSAKLINARADQIAFIPNTSEGVAAIANGLRWREGDNVVSCADEFPANIYPWMNLANQGVKLKLAQSHNGRVSTEEILDLIDDRTRVVALSFVQYATGQRMDLATIGKYCREREVFFFVDPIQGLGALKLDVEANFVDALSANSHKFLMGPGGVGLMYLSDYAMSVVQPSIVGWLSVENAAEAFSPNLTYHLDQPLHLHSGAARFESGNPNIAGIFGLGAALETILEIGIEQIEAHLIGLTDRLSNGLRENGYHVFSPRDENEKSAIVCCTHPQHSSESIRNKLLSEKIITADRCGRCRIAPHLYNMTEEIDKLLTTLPT
jgi:selenocysteine lyase/cysteine desulfurase